MSRTFGDWLRWRVQRIPRKLRLARRRAIWLYWDARNEWRILWELRMRHRPIADVTRYERRIDSQNGEDGILEAIFAKIGTTNRYFVEFGCGDLSECNSLHLARRSGWRGLWMDAQYVDRLGRVRRELITAENIQALLQRYQVPREFDLLSIDIDGNDYWVWRAMTDYRPRVAVIEYNSTIPPIESKSVPYDPAYLWDRRTNYYGVSLLALKTLGDHKGYTLVGCDSSGTNAFFVRRELVADRFAIRDVQAVYRPPTVFDGQGHPRDPRPFVEV
jgi:hypothetical protein